MWKILGTLALMLVCGWVTMILSLLFSTEMGAGQPDGYEWAGRRPVIFLGPGVIGFLAPGVVVWLEHRRRAREIRIRSWGGSTILGTFLGAVVGLEVGILGAVTGKVVGRELHHDLIPVFCGFLGLLQGALGALSGTWGRGLLIGVVVSALSCCWWLVIGWCFPPGLNVCAVTVWLMAGAAAGAVGGVVRQKLDKKDQTAKA